MTAEISLGDLVKRRLSESQDLISAMSADADLLRKVEAVGELLVTAFGAGRKLLLFGNGGSATDSIHIAGEFAGRFLLDRRPLSAHSLSENIASVTAIGNDYGYDLIFERQIKAFGEPGDVALGLSTSGRSQNVVLGLEAASGIGLSTVAFTGRGPGAVGAASDFLIDIPSESTPQIQQAHMLVAHLLCEWVELQLVAGRF